MLKNTQHVCGGVGVNQHSVRWGRAGRTKPPYCAGVPPALLALPRALCGTAILRYWTVVCLVCAWCPQVPCPNGTFVIIKVFCLSSVSFAVKMIAILHPLAVLSLVARPSTPPAQACRPASVVGALVGASTCAFAGAGLSQASTPVALGMLGSTGFYNQEVLFTDYLTQGVDAGNTIGAFVLVVAVFIMLMSPNALENAMDMAIEEVEACLVDYGDAGPICGKGIAPQSTRPRHRARPRPSHHR